MDLHEKIKGDYRDIVRFNEQQGTQAQRETVCQPIYTPIRDQYPSFGGYQDEANLGLGCGFPFAYADIRPGDVVLDLGCAAGIDTFIASELVGPSGHVTGVDITPELTARAQRIADTSGISNVSFICSDLSQVPLPDHSADVIISNGVFSLITDLDQAFAEVARLLKPNGTFCIADITRKKDVAEPVYSRIKVFTGCLNGIRNFDTYVRQLEKNGLARWKLVHERAIELPDEVASEKEQNEIVISTINAKM